MTHTIIVSRLLSVIIMIAALEHSVVGSAHNKPLPIQKTETQLAEQMREDFENGKARTAETEQAVWYLNYDIRPVQPNDPVPTTRSEQIEWCLLHYPQLTDAFTCLHQDDNAFFKFLQKNYPAKLLPENKNFLKEFDATLMQAENIIKKEIKNHLIPELETYNPDFIHTLDLQTFDTLEKLSPMDPVNSIQNSENLHVQYALANKDFFTHPTIEEALREWIIKTPDRADSSGSTLLHKAAVQNNATVVKLLVEQAQADINITTSNGFTPLHAAVILQKFDMVQLLLASQANPNLKTNTNDTALSYARLLHTLNTRQNNRYLQIAELLIQFGADINMRYEQGDTLLHDAAVHNDFPFAELLLAQPNIDLTIQNDENKTAAQLARTPAMKALFAQATAGR